MAKINFEINMLPNVEPFEGDTIMEALANCDELEVFQIHVVMDMIDYKFQTFAYSIHRVGFFIHTIYIMMLMFYINKTFLQELDLNPDGSIANHPPPTYWALKGMLVCMIYPTLFDGNQMLKQKMEYLEDPWNYIDVIHISCSYLNIYFQMYSGTLDFRSQCVFILILLTSLIKLFFFLRIFEQLTYIVTMIVQVAKDL